MSSFNIDGFKTSDDLNIDFSLIFLLSLDNSTNELDLLVM